MLNMDLPRSVRGRSWVTSLGLVRWLGLWVLLVSLVGCTAFDEWQRRKVLRPTPIATDAQWQHMLKTRPDVQARTLPLAQGEWLQVLQVPPPAGLVVSRDGAEVRVLYLHGVLRHAFENLRKLDGVARNGLVVWAPDYRGWGRSSPLLPDEDSLHADVWAVWQSLPRTNEQGRPIRWVIHGHSMGTALAVRLAQRISRGEPNTNPDAPSNYCALVIESGFTSFGDIAADAAGVLGPLGRIATTQRMASNERIGQVKGPMWFIHGSQDKTVPLRLGRELFELAPEPKQWRDIPLGHSNLQTDTTGVYDGVWQQVKERCAEPGP